MSLDAAGVPPCFLKGSILKICSRLPHVLVLHPLLLVAVGDDCWGRAGAMRAFSPIGQMCGGRMAGVRMRFDLPARALFVQLSQA